MDADLFHRLGLDCSLGPGGTDRGHGLCECLAAGAEDKRFRFEVHSVRPARRLLQTARS